LSPEPEDARRQRLLSVRRPRNSPAAPSNGVSVPVEPQPPLAERPIAYAIPEAVDEQSLLRNPYVLAGLAVGTAIVLAVMFVIVSGGGGSGRRSSPYDENAVGIGGGTQEAGRGIQAKTIAAAAVREGPSTDYMEIAPMRSGQTVDVIGRNADSSWYQIYYPPQSQLKGWLPATALRLPSGSGEALAVVAVTPISRPTVAVPTLPPPPPETPTATAVATPTPEPGPDVALAFAGICQAGVPLVVGIRNAGPAPIVNRQVRVTIASATGVQGVADSTVSLEPGTVVNLSTSQVVAPPRAFARVDLLGIPTDVNVVNNSAECAVQGAPVLPLVTPGIPQFPTPVPTRRIGP
jgi:Bacterial SH3 domain